MELQHHGVKGMKWGIRKKREVHSDYAKAHSRKSVKQMSDQELRERNNRLNAEEQYRRNRENSTSIGRGKRIAKRVVTGAVIGLASSKAMALVKKGDHKFTSDIFPRVKDLAIGPLMTAAGYALEKDFV